MSVLALIPARAGSKSCPGKNLRTLGGKTLIEIAVDCAMRAGSRAVITSDYESIPWSRGGPDAVPHIHRPAELATDSAPMLAVVQHALQQIPGPSDQIIVLLQPTQPFRKPEHVQEAIRLLRGGMDYDAVVSIVPIPRTHAPQFIVRYDNTCLEVYPAEPDSWGKRPTRRQAVQQPYICDGTVYAFWRRTVEQYGTLFGERVGPLLIDPADSCELDTPEDWLEVERRWRERHG